MCESTLRAVPAFALCSCSRMWVLQFRSLPAAFPGQFERGSGCVLAGGGRQGMRSELLLGAPSSGEGGRGGGGEDGGTPRGEVVAGS